MPLTIRPFTDDDRAEMAAVYSAVWHATYDAIDGAEAINRVIAALLEGEAPAMFVMPPGDVALVAEFGGRLIGGVRGHPRDGSVHLSGMYVTPDAQRQGVGGELLAELFRWFPRGATYRADVRPTSWSAGHFYARHGFVEIGRGRTDVGGNYWVDMIELKRGSGI